MPNTEACGHSCCFGFSTLISVSPVRSCPWSFILVTAASTFLDEGPVKYWCNLIGQGHLWRWRMGNCHRAAITQNLNVSKIKLTRATYRTSGGYTTYKSSWQAATQTCDLVSMSHTTLISYTNVWLGEYESHNTDKLYKSNYHVSRSRGHKHNFKLHGWLHILSAIAAVHLVMIIIISGATIHHKLI